MLVEKQQGGALKTGYNFIKMHMACEQLRADVRDYYTAPAPINTATSQRRKRAL